jgi:hypothetical protein
VAVAALQFVPPKAAFLQLREVLQLNRVEPPLPKSIETAL